MSTNVTTEHHDTDILNSAIAEDHDTAFLTLQRGGIETPVHTVMWEGFFTGYLNYGLNCAGVYSK